MCVTKDNASSNQTFVENLPVQLISDNGYFSTDDSVWCLAHIMNLAIKFLIEPMKDLFSKGIC